MKARVVSSNVPLRMGNTSNSPKKKQPMLFYIWKISGRTSRHLKQLLVFISRLLRLWILMNTRYVYSYFYLIWICIKKVITTLLPSPLPRIMIKLNLHYPHHLAGEKPPLGPKSFKKHKPMNQRCQSILSCFLDIYIISITLKICTGADWGKVWRKYREGGG